MRGSGVVWLVCAYIIPLMSWNCKRFWTKKGGFLRFCEFLERMQSVLCDNSYFLVEMGAFWVEIIVFWWGIYGGAGIKRGADKVRCYAVLCGNGDRSWVEQGLVGKVGVVCREVSRELGVMTGGCRGFCCGSLVGNHSPLCTLFREVYIPRKAYSYAVFRAFCVFLRFFSLCVPIPYLIYTRKRAQKLQPVFCENLCKSEQWYYVSVPRAQRKHKPTGEP